MTAMVREITCRCTTFGCPNGMVFAIPFEDTDEPEVVQGKAVGLLQSHRWGADHFGILCPVHLPHRVGKRFW